MANNDGFIDFLSPNALADLKEGNALVLTSIENVKKLNQLMSGQNTPGASGNAQNALTQQLLAQQNALAGLQRQYTSAAAVQRQRTQQTAEEAVNQGILNRNARQSAVINSTLAGAYQRLSAQQARAARTLQDLIASQTASNAQIRAAQREFDNLNRRVLLADRAVGRFNRNVGNYPRAAILGLKDLVGAFGLVTGVAAIAAITTNIYENVKAQQSLDLALKQVTGTTAEYARAQEFISQTAAANGAEINALQSAYTKFYVSASNKLAVKEIEDIFSTFTKAGSVLGLSIENQDRAFIALGQMMSKGTLQAEELRGQLGDALPGAVGIATRAYQKLHPELKVTEASFAKLMKDGKILSAEILPEMARELGRTYNLDTIKNIDTLAASQNRLTNEWKEFIRELNDGDGTISRLFARSTNGFANMLNSINKAIKSDSELRKEDLQSYRTSLYTQELDALQALGDGAKAQAQIRKPIIEKELADNNALRDSLLKRYTTEKLTTEERLKLYQLIKVANNDAYGSAGQLDAINKVLNANIQKNTKTNIDLTDKERKALEKLREELLKNASARRISDLERQKFLIETRLEDEAKYADDKIALSQMIADKEIAIATQQFLENIRLHAKSKDLQAIDANNFRTAQEKAEKEHQDRILKIQTDRNDAFREDREKNGRLTGNNDGSGFAERYLPTEELDKLVNDWEEFKKKQLETEEEYNKKLLEESKKTIADYIKGFSEGFFSDAGAPTIFKILNDEIEGFGENGAATALAITEAFQEAFNLISSASQENFDAAYERLEKEKNVAILFAGESAAAKEQVERDYDEKRKQLQRREAQAAKEIAVFNVIINTAQAIISALATAKNIYAGIALSIFAAAVGATQLAAINAAQPPSFFKGTDNAPGGYAWVDERGPEIHTDKHGNIKSTGSKKGANLRMLEKGDKILTHEKSKALMFDNGLNNILSNNGISASPNITLNNDNTQLLSALNGVKNSIDSKPVGGMEISDGEMKSYIIVNNKKLYKANCAARNIRQIFT